MEAGGSAGLEGSMVAGDVGDEGWAQSCTSWILALTE